MRPIARSMPVLPDRSTVCAREWFPTQRSGSLHRESPSAHVGKGVPHKAASCTQFETVCCPLVGQREGAAAMRGTHGATVSFSGQDTPAVLLVRNDSTA